MKKYHGWKTVWTLMNMSYGRWQREPEDHVRARLDLIKSKNGINS